MVASGIQKGFLLNQEQTKKSKRRTDADSKAKPRNVALKSGFLLTGSKAAPKAASIKSKDAQRGKQSKPMFAKGFLVSKKQTKSKTPKNAALLPPGKAPSKTQEINKDLLALDDTAAEKRPHNSSLLLINEDGEVDHPNAARKQPTSNGGGTRPLISVIEEAPSSTLRDTQEAPRRPLITVMSNETETSVLGDNLPHATQEPKGQDIESMSTTIKEDEAWLTQISSRTKGPDLESEALMDSHSQSNPESISHSMHPQSHERMRSTYIQFQQDLARIPWRGKDSLQDLSMDWDEIQISWAWDWMLSGKAIQKTAKRKKKNHPLIASILYHHPDSAIPRLSTESAERRTNALHVIEWIKTFVSMRDHATIPKAKIWRTAVLDSLLELADHDKRTVLAQEAWAGTVTLISWICKTHGLDNETDYGDIAMPLMNKLDKIVRIQISWKKQKETSMKNQTSLALLDEWSKTNSYFRKRNLFSSWLQHITGCSVEDRSDWGSIRHCLCPSAKARKRPDYASIFHSLLQMESALDQRLVLRGILAELMVEKRPIDVTEDVIVNGTTGLLSKCKDMELVDLCLSLLSILWTTSNVQESDIQEVESGLPTRIKMLLDTLPSSVSSEWLGPAHAVGLLLARFVLETNKRALGIVESIERMYGRTDSTTIVLLCILKLLHQGDLALDETCGTLKGHIVASLLNTIEFSKYLRKQIQSSNGFLLADCDVDQVSTTGILVDFLVRHSSRPKAESIEIESCALLSLTALLERCCGVGKENLYAKSIISALRPLTSGSSSKEDVHALVCSRAGKAWRLLLLEKQSIPDTSFGSFVAHIAKTFLAEPESLSHLTLFGSIIGESLPHDENCEQWIRRRVLMLVETILEVTIDHFKKFLWEEVSNSVFDRLAPLLLLRRLPMAYFEVSHLMASPSGNQTIGDLFDDLGRTLASLLDIPTSLALHYPVTLEERRLAAEVAGRSLRYDRAMYFLYSPAFNESVGGSTVDSPKKAIKRSRAALYAACSHISAMNIESHFPFGFHTVASFALHVICVDLADLVEDVGAELIKLQTGCIEFFGICFQRLLSRSNNAAKKPVNSLVEPMDSFLPSIERPSDSTLRAADSISEVVRAVVDILRLGSTSQSWIYKTNQSSLGKATEEVPLQARTCLWNVLIVTAQRCPTEDGSLYRFGLSTLPWIVDWVRPILSGNGDESVHSPVCEAAGMQVIFTVLTRAKSFRSFETATGRTTKDTVNSIYQWSMHAFKSVESTDSISTKLRLASLKLVLCLVTLDCTQEGESNSTGFLDPGQLNHLLSLVRGLANLDQDQETRRFASHIMQALQANA